MNILNWCYFNPPMPPDLKSVGLLFFCTDLSVVLASAFSSWRKSQFRELIKLKKYLVKKIFNFHLGKFLLHGCTNTSAPQERSGVRMRMSSSGWGKDWICLVVVLSGWFGWFACTYLHICIFFFIILEL